jgi:glutaredoxin
MSPHRKLIPLLVFAAVLVLSQNWWRIDLALNPLPADQLSANNVTLYSTSWCSYCAKTRRFFKAANVPYIERDIEKSPEAMRHYKELGGRGVPFLVINGKRIQGFDTAAIRIAITQNN